MSWDGTVGTVSTAIGNGLNYRGVEVRVLVRGKIFLFSRSSILISRVHLASYPMGTRAVSQLVRQPGLEVDHSPTTITKGKNMWIYTSTLPYVFMA
jgi:hypothetical protein